MRLFNLQEWLAILNGAWGTAAICLGLVMLAYLSHEGIARRIFMGGWDKRFTVGMRIACAVFLLAFGVLVTRIDIYVWRILGGGPFTEHQLVILLLGGTIGTAGFVWANREYSEPLFGRWVWISSAIATVASGAATALWILLH